MLHLIMPQLVWGRGGGVREWGNRFSEANNRRRHVYQFPDEKARTEWN